MVALITKHTDYCHEVCWHLSMFKFIQNISVSYFSAFLKVGGFDQMVEKYPDSMSNFTRYSNTSCGRPGDDYMHLFRDPVSGDLPWPGIIGVTINSIWYWCSDQVCFLAFILILIILVDLLSNQLHAKLYF